MSMNRFIHISIVLLLPLCATGAEDCGTGHKVTLNQEGFYPRGPKLAVVAAPQTRPLDFEVVSDDGSRLLTGKTSVHGADPVSGDHLHHADFSDVRTAASGLRLRTACGTSHPFRIASEPYGELRYDALRYFYHNRSGVPIDAAYAGGKDWARPAGHTRDVATCREGLDPHGNEWPGCDYTLDLTGGWYDAGDHGKYVVNGGIAVWTLMNLYERQQAVGADDTFNDGQLLIPEAGNGVSDLLDEARFQLEFLLRMQAPADAAAAVPVGVKRNAPGVQFTRIDAGGMAHHKVADDEWTPLPTPPHLDQQPRVLYPVSTAATLNLAATAAQCARIWRDVDAAFAARCLEAAERAWAGARRNPEVYFIADFSGSGMYGDSDLGDEFFWAAAELYVATGRADYRSALEKSPHFDEPPGAEPAWPQVAPLGLISLSMVPSDLDRRLVRDLRGRLVAAADTFLAERERSGYRIPYASDRYAWGSNSNVLNRGLMLALAFDFTGKRRYRDAVVDALDYILGRNPLDISYVSAYGERAMQNPHHRFWAPSADAMLPPPPPGALSGGPNSTNPAEEVAKALIDEGCAPQTCWSDDIRAYSLNEVAINWNAPLVWVAAFLDQTAR